jgi:glycosyltransferase involved in cell wall biosynthesis
MRIALIVYGSLETISGGYVFDRMLVAHLRSEGDTVEIISLRRHSYGRNLLDNLGLRLPAGFDIVLEDELCHPSLLQANAGRHAFPIVGMIHNLRSSERRSAFENAAYRRIERRYLASVDGFVVNSEATCASVMALSATSTPYVVVQPGGDRLGSGSWDQIQQRLETPGPLRLLFLANVTAGKGLEIVLDALSSLPADGFVLDVVGSTDVEPAYAERMRRRVKDHGLPVTFWEALDGERLVTRLQHCDVLVLPSFYEGFGIAYLEGMGYGLPAIGTTAGAIPELIADGVNGFLIPPGDSRSLAQRLTALAQDRALLLRLSLVALQTYQSRSTWREAGQRVRDFLLRLVGDRQPGARAVESP